MLTSCHCNSTSNYSRGQTGRCVWVCVLFRHMLLSHFLWHSGFSLLISTPVNYDAPGGEARRQQERNAPLLTALSLKQRSTTFWSCGREHWWFLEAGEFDIEGAWPGWEGWHDLNTVITRRCLSSWVEGQCVCGWRHRLLARINLYLALGLCRWWLWTCGPFRSGSCVFIFGE